MVSSMSGIYTRRTTFRFGEGGVAFDDFPLFFLALLNIPPPDNIRRLVPFREGGGFICRGTGDTSRRREGKREMRGKEWYHRLHFFCWQVLVVEC